MPETAEAILGIAFLLEPSDQVALFGALIEEDFDES